MRLVFFTLHLCVAVLTFVSLVDAQAQWTPPPIVIPEQEFTRAWGTPARVHLPWGAFNTLRTRQASADDCCYVFRYSVGSALAKAGPLGEAFEADVLVTFDGMVGGVNWDYSNRRIALGDIRRLAGNAPMTVKPLSFGGESAGTYEFAVGGRSVFVLYVDERSDVVVQLRP